ncbi:uncharacterized protein LOC114680192 isoform X3 [Macaca mulatta]
MLCAAGADRGTWGPRPMRKWIGPSTSGESRGAMKFFRGGVSSGRAGRRSQDRDRSSAPSSPTTRSRRGGGSSKSQNDVQGSGIYQEHRPHIQNKRWTTSRLADVEDLHM